MRLIIVDDSMIVREGLARLLELLGHTVIGSLSRVEPALALVDAERPDVVLADIRMPPTYTDEGLRLADELRRKAPGTAVLVLSQHVYPEYARRLFEHEERGRGYLLKDRILDAGALDAALNRLRRGGSVLDATLVQDLLRARNHGSPLNELTDREKDVLALMAEGMSDRGISAQLHLSLNTVGTHVQHIFRKLGLPIGASENRRVHAVLTYLAVGHAAERT